MDRQSNEAFQCQADTSSGNRCTNAALPGDYFCYHHLYLQRAVRRAIVVSAVLLATTIVIPYVMPELTSLMSCFAIFAATIAGLEIAILKARKTG